ncbi:MAG: hypothetical protein UT41_C0001G0022 [Candidatus Wolfebacteria bacterium GW2011_GWC2_39_22]|uniref:Uncharacterized protein n=1 Tax=Candidatus Wolfebacteria bacterium GW2011_GWC2_39_22 TaxID=1619013 RepID=A0A0G0NAH4_9BACT|nr:MAG: hypothetical protein UT41_C0001G0022 [Candidatus Wolfebacteria bacterium GW2011_GWC2_39_22]HBI25843.1 hypothetical protein [Candidatus Wolfebacteria bacterium]
MLQFFTGSGPELLTTFALLIAVTVFLNLDTSLGITRFMSDANPLGIFVGCVLGVALTFLSLGFAIYIGHNSGKVAAAGTPTQTLIAGEPYRVDATVEDSLLLTQTSTNRRVYFQLRLTDTMLRVGDLILVDNSGRWHTTRPTTKAPQSP